MAQTTGPKETGLLRELDLLSKLPIRDLRIRWRKIFRKEPPKAFGPDLLRRSIAYRLQELAFGSLSKASQKSLQKLIRSIARDASGRLKLKRQIKPGSTIVREWKGKSHHVTVTSRGFSYEGVDFDSLSEVARRITGTHWNGPRFFGLRGPKTENVDSASKAA